MKQLNSIWNTYDFFETFNLINDSKVTILTGRPGIGKTEVLLNYFKQLSYRTNSKALYLSYDTFPHYHKNIVANNCNIICLTLKNNAKNSVALWLKCIYLCKFKGIRVIGIDDIEIFHFFYKNIKILSKIIKIPLICTTKLNRTVEYRKNHLPMISDIDSKLIDIATRIILIHKDSYYSCGKGNKEYKFIVLK